MYCPILKKGFKHGILFICIILLFKSRILCCDLTMGLMKRSYFGGLRVKPSPTKQTLVTILFHAFFCLFPVLITLSTSVSPWARTFGRGTSHLPWRKHYTFVFTNPWHYFHTSTYHYHNIFFFCPKAGNLHCGMQLDTTVEKGLPMSRYLQPSLSSSVWSCWRGP